MTPPLHIPASLQDAASRGEQTSGGCARLAPGYVPPPLPGQEPIGYVAIQMFRNTIISKGWAMTAVEFSEPF
jgi:hypothetical protein